MNKIIKISKFILFSILYIFLMNIYFIYGNDNLILYFCLYFNILIIIIVIYIKNLERKLNNNENI